jgi:hypothetical protein
VNVRNKVIVVIFIFMLIAAGVGFSQNAMSGTYSDTSIEVFTVNGIDVTELPGLEVSDPANDRGAFLETSNFNSFAGIMVKAYPRIEVNNPYHGVNWDNFNQYKANLHTHTTYSDGIKPPHARIDEYFENGYSILALTDHDDYNPEGPLLYPWTNLSSINENWENRDPVALGMVAVEGLEISAGIHLGSHFNSFVGEASDDEAYVLSKIKENGGLAQFYHPGRYTLNNPDNLVDWYADMYRQFDCLVGMEVYNGRDLFPRDRQLWDNVLMQTLPDKVVWAFGNDDNHVSSTRIDFLLSWNMFVLEELNLASVKNAYEKGVFFACNKNSPNAPPPPVVSSIELTNDLLTITATGYDSISWIADGELVGADSSIDISDLKYENKYIRAKLFSSENLFQGRTLIQPFQFIPHKSNSIINISLNGITVAPELLESVTLKENDEILVTITAEDGTATRFYKLTVVGKSQVPLSPGDINGDGKIDVLDVTLTLQYVLGTHLLDEKQLAASDVNGDGEVDVLDVTLILQFALGLIDSFA